MSNDKSAPTEPVLVDPPEVVWRDPMPASREERIAFFRREGFLILAGLVDADELRTLRADLERAASGHDDAAVRPVTVDVEQQQDKQRDVTALRKISGMTQRAESFARLARHPRLVAWLHDLLGPVLQLYRDVVMMKAARVGRQKPWHQDSVYWPWRPMDLVSVMTALDDATVANGCLQIIPRSHTSVLPHHGGEQQIDLDPAWQARTVAVPLRAGDALLFHSLLLHASEPNRSDDDRRVVISAYKNPAMKFVGEGEPPECPVIE